MTAPAPVSDVTLFGHWLCPYSVRVSFALAERRIAHDVVEVPPTAARPGGFVVPAEFIEHSPRGEIPMVRSGTEYRVDSLPILEWLEERIPDRPLLATGEAERAMVRERTAWIDNHVFPPMIGIYYGIHADRVAEAGAALAESLRVMGEWLDDRLWLAGAAPSLAEAAVSPVYVRLEALRRLGFTGAVDARVTAHRDRCTDLAGWAAVAWSDRQTDELVDRSTRHRARARRAPAG